MRDERGYALGERLSNTWTTYPQIWDNSGKLEIIPDNPWTLECLTVESFSV